MDELKVKHCSSCDRLEPEAALHNGLCFMCNAYLKKEKADARFFTACVFITLASLVGLAMCALSCV